MRLIETDDAITAVCVGELEFVRRCHDHAYVRVLGEHALVSAVQHNIISAKQAIMAYHNHNVQLISQCVCVCIQFVQLR